MATTKDRLRADLTGAMRARDRRRVATLRLSLAAISTEEVSGSAAHELDDAAEQAVLAREARRRHEAAGTYEAAGRPELAGAERAEAVIIEEYLPRPLDDEGVRAVVRAAVDRVREATGSTPGRAQMGQVMRAATAGAAGRADGSRLSAAVREALS